VYRTASRRQTRTIEVGSPVTAVAYAPRGRLIAVGTIYGEVRFFDPASGASVGSPLDEGWDSAVWQVAFSPDGRLLAVAVDPNGVGEFFRQQQQGEVQLWSVGPRTRVGGAIVPGGGSVLSLAFSRDGTLLATGSHRGRVDLRDVATQARHGNPMKVADDNFASVAFAPERQLVAAGDVGPVRVWRVDDQRAAFPPLSGHPGPVTGAAFDPDDAFLATTDVLGETKLSDPATGLPYGDLLVGSPKPESLVDGFAGLPWLPLRNAFSPDGKLLAVGGFVTLAMLWDVDPAVWRRRACTIAGRNLTREEWKLYLPPGKPYRATCADWPTG
jgi:WD40 repeat protein